VLAGHGGERLDERQAFFRVSWGSPGSSPRVEAFFDHFQRFGNDDKTFFRDNKRVESVGKSFGNHNKTFFRYQKGFGRPDKPFGVPEKPLEMMDKGFSKPPKPFAKPKKTLETAPKVLGITPKPFGVTAKGLEMRASFAPRREAMPPFE
jgi:hypothetical protein